VPLSAAEHKSCQPICARAPYYCFDTPVAERLREILHQSPLRYGKETSVWALELVAEVASEQGLTAWRVSDEGRACDLGLHEGALAARQTLGE